MSLDRPRPGPRGGVSLNRMVRFRLQMMLRGWALAAAGILAVLLVVDSTPRLRATLVPVSPTAGGPTSPAEEHAEEDRAGTEQVKQNGRRRTLLRQSSLVRFLPRGMAAADTHRFSSESHPLAIATEHAMRNGLGAPLRQ